ncbi:hypothetical protein VDGD_20116 [Verticillium dahliae]|nr:hypothetical protein VDGD_20116 [Verticillium dahliae]
MVMSLLAAAPYNDSRDPHIHLGQLSLRRPAAAAAAAASGDSRQIQVIFFESNSNYTSVCLFKTPPRPTKTLISRTPP